MYTYIMNRTQIYLSDAEAKALEREAHADLVGDRDPVAVLAETPARIQELVALYRRLTREQRDRPIRHPEFGGISVAWIIRVLAGHDLHHLQHLRTIAER
jgi:hypothetical protein